MGGSFGCVLVVEVWEIFFMMFIIVVTCNLRCEIGERGFLKICLFLENFCLYVYMKWFFMRFENGRKKFFFLRVLFG